MFLKQKKVRLPDEYKQLQPLSDNLRAKKAQLDLQLKENLISRKKFVVVCGPCSADESTEEYIGKLKEVADQCPDLFVVARIYTSKPHSNGQGFKGAVFHLRNDDEVDIDKGILFCRKLMIKCIESGIPVADELLYPELYECFDDLVSYWFVGARSSEDTLHRDFASGLDICCGLKNATDGNVEKVVDSLYAVSHPCIFPYNGAQIVTSGCGFAHIVLRGGLNEGVFRPNIYADSVSHAKNLLVARNLNDFVMADLNHANSGKVAAKQVENAVVAINAGVDGVMIESSLYSGGQSDKYGVSKTDDCLGFDDTQKLLMQIQLLVTSR